MSPRVKDLLISLSLANLLLPKQWADGLLPATSAYTSDAMSSSLLLADLLWLALIAALLFGLLRLIERSPRSKRWVYSAFAALLLFKCYRIRSYSNFSVQYPWISVKYFLGDWGASANLAKVGLLGILGAALAYRQRTHLPQYLRGFLVCCFPFLPLVLAQNAHALYADYQALQKTPTRVVAKADRPAHVVWMIFDEMDQDWAFDSRPTGLELPELDRLRSETFHASHAYPPANATVRSIPAYLTGKLVHSVRPLSREELQVRFCSEPQPQALSHQSTVFDDARSLGYATALVGWFHPYCRLFAQSLDECWRGSLYGETDASFSEGLMQVARGWLHPNETWPERHTRLFHSLVDKAEKIIADPTRGLVFVHWPLPHYPRIQSSAKAPPLTGDARAQEYFDNLVLVDHILARLRERLTRDGLWDSTTLLVTSDHWWRYAQEKAVLGREPSKLQLPRIPFLMKLAGQHEEYRFDEPFNAVNLRALVGALLRREVTDAPQLAAWFRANRSLQAPQIDTSAVTPSLPMSTCHTRLSPRLTADLEIPFASTYNH